jgi:hypothetical protein
MIEKRLILSLFFLFAISVAYLFSVNERGLDPNQGKDWWSLAFSRPEDVRSLAFTITNHTHETAFRYSVTREGGAVLTEGTLTIEPGTAIEHTPVESETGTGRITITVTHDGREETIYRQL